MDEASFFSIQSDLEDAWAVAHVPEQWQEGLTRILVWLSLQPDAMITSEVPELHHYLISVINYPERMYEDEILAVDRILAVASEMGIVSFERSEEDDTVYWVWSEPLAVVYLSGVAKNWDATLRMLQLIDSRDPGTFGTPSQRLPYALHGHWKDLALAVIDCLVSAGTNALEGSYHKVVKELEQFWVDRWSEEHHLRFAHGGGFLVGVDTLVELGLLNWEEETMSLDEDVATVFLTARS